MALKDIFTMVKADRYTADGCEELNKARETATEDARRTYQIGEISESTGLQKTANGWVKPKKGAAGKAATESKPSNPGVPIQGSNWLSLPSGTRVTNETARERVTQNNERIETIKKQMEGKTKAENFRLGSELKKLQDENEYITSRLPPEESKPAEETKTETTAKFETEQENTKYEEGKKGWETVSKERLPDIKKKVEQKIDYYKKYDPYAMLGKRTGLNAAQKKAVEQNMVQAKENLAFFTGQLEGINEQMGASDAAPRVLTGDCKIRVRKA